MQCEECGKKPATVHITRIENGKKTDLHFCEQCAVQKNALNMSTSFSINDLLTGLLNSGNFTPIKVDFVQDIQCEFCGMTYTKFRETGRFGCSNCYKTFLDKLTPLFKRVHGNTSHIGKVPTRAGNKIKTQREIERLRQELSKAIGCEEYEKAASIRDQIRELNKAESEGE